MTGTITSRSIAALIIALLSAACGPSTADGADSRGKGSDLATAVGRLAEAPKAPVAEKTVKFAAFDAATASPDDAQAASVLIAAEGDIAQAVRTAQVSRDLVPLAQVVASLEALDVGTAPTLAYYKTYWLAYANYQSSIEFQRAGRTQDPEAPLRRAIALLEQAQPSDSEIQALYGLAMGLNLQFVPRQDIMNEIPKVNRALARSLALDGENPRALYANAISDENTPEEYGGGHRAEGYVRQCLSTSPASARPLAPNWGPDLCAALLVEILLKDGRQQDAAQAYADGRRRWPQSAALAELASKF